MAVYETPVQHEDHFIERDSNSNSGAFWAVLAVIVVVLALLLFGSRLFGRGTSTGTSSGTGASGGTNINGSLNTPSGTYQGSGSVTQ